MNADDAKANAADLLAKVTFGSARDHIGWLEFWVYMCNKGVRPDDSLWLGEEMNDSEIL
jgi:hypothetical protein